MAAFFFYISLTLTPPIFIHSCSDEGTLAAQLRKRVYCLFFLPQGLRPELPDSFVFIVKLRGKVFKYLLDCSNKVTLADIWQLTSEREAKHNSPYKIIYKAVSRQYN